MREIALMNEKAIALTVFFISVFLLYQIRFILRLRKLRKINRNMNEDGFVLGASLSSFCDCCEDADEVYEVLQEKKAQRQSEKYEQKNKEKRKIEHEKYIAGIEKERIIRKKRVEELRASGYATSEKDRKEVLEIVSINPETNLSWTSTSTRIPIEDIIIIIEDEPDFEIRDEKIIYKKKILEKEEKIRIAKITCPSCENLFEPGSDFCPNCGSKL